jgi:hypothetical protein
MAGIGHFLHDYAINLTDLACNQVNLYYSGLTLVNSVGVRAPARKYKLLIISQRISISNLCVGLMVYLLSNKGRMS